jgi:hypothetical protein
VTFESRSKKSLLVTAALKRILPRAAVKGALRTHRMNPRVVRVQTSKWPRKRKKHHDYSQPKKKFRDRIVIRL